MDNEELQRRKSLSFAQAEGIEPIPSQYALGELGAATKARLWFVVHHHLKHYESDRNYELIQPMKGLALRYFIEELHLMADDFDPDVNVVKETWKKNFAPEKPYHTALGFVQWLLRNYENNNFSDQIGLILEETRSAYRVIDGDTLMPAASREEVEARNQSLAITATSGMLGSRKHLLDAGAALTSGDFATSVRESISAVEAVAFASTGEKSFSKAIGVMDGRRPMNGAFKIAINQLYNYTSQVPGIRHANRESADTDVTERDALFMLGVCASFVTYVLAE